MACLVILGVPTILTPLNEMYRCSSPTWSYLVDTQEEEEEDEGAVPKGHHVRQDGSGGNALQKNLRAVEACQDLYVQVGLPGLGVSTSAFNKVIIGTIASKMNEARVQ